ncbi:hypothetical protein ACFQ61_10020 [Streptomyces sp. NPDC056500]|uniref:hypothetical protein n=1 Tax=Streptomyces sp. NPDC056500 TaxID=3345840 RepID=UPI0036C6AAC0
MAIPGNFMSNVTSSMDPNISGWTAKLNCTVALGTGGRVGDGCLVVTSVAAGSVEARSVASYKVTVGREYQTFGDTSGTVPQHRIGIRWLDAADAQLSINWGVSTLTASASWHRVSSAAIAPTGAVRAQVLVGVLGIVAGGVNSFWENIYFGLPKRTTGNLLSFGAETIERASPPWSVDSNCSTARQTPAVTWEVDNYTAGGNTLAMTVTANGNASVRTSERPAASAGTEYVGYCYLSPPTGPSSNAWVELRWYNAANSQIGTDRAVLNAPGTGTYRQKVSAVAPAGAVAVGLAAGLTSATAAQVLRVDGAVIHVAEPLREGSVVPYADASFEAGVGGWTVPTGVATLARLTPWGTDGLEGSYAGVLTSATATTSVLRSARFPIGASAPGLNFSAEVGARVMSGGWTLTRAIRWYDAANTDLGATAGSPAAVPGSTWWYLRHDAVAPAGATQAAIEWTLTATATSSVLRIDGAALWQSLPLISVIGHDDLAYVTVTLRELTPGHRISVWRVTATGARTLVRGPAGLLESAVLTTDTLILEDYEAPLGVPVTYYAEARDTDDVVTATRSSPSVTLDAGDPDLCWLKDPANPQRNLRAMVVRPPEWSRPIQQSVHRVVGRRDAVIRSDVRGGLEGTLVVWTLSDAGAEQMHRLLDAGAVLLWQVAPGTHEEDQYVSVAAVSLPRLVPDRNEEWREWTLPLTVVGLPVALGVAGSAGRTWQDILTEHATWAEVADRYATWEDVLFNRPIGE